MDSGSEIDAMLKTRTAPLKIEIEHSQKPLWKPRRLRWRFYDFSM